jgi:hypothetical protein
MFRALGHFHDGVKVHHAFVEPIGIAAQYRHGGIRARIELTAQKGSIDFGSGVTCDELWLFEIEKVGKKSPSDIRDVTHRLRTDAEAGLRPKFFEIVQTKIFARVDGLVANGFRGAEVDKFIEIVEHAVFAHDVE